MNIEVHIERVVLDGGGVEGLALDLLSMTVRTHLTQRFAETILCDDLVAGRPFELVGGETGRVRDVSRSIGVQVADTVCGALSAHVRECPATSDSAAPTADLNGIEDRS